MLLKTLCHETGTDSDEWKELDHPSSGVGIERWFKNFNNGDEYYCFEDQGHVSIQKLE